VSGWIKLHRSIQGHFIYDFSEPDKALAWIDILLSASYTESKVKIKSKVFSVQKGQWLVSQVTLQKRWKMSQNKVKRLLNMLQNDGMIDVLTNELTSVITICNFSNYQDDERSGGQPHGRTVERATDEQSNDIQRNKELKEGNKKRKSAKSASFEPSSELTFSQKAFNVFWDNVEKRRVGKSDALKAFEKYTQGKSEDEIDFMLNVICHWYGLYLKEDESRLLPENKRFLKHASTWLNSEPWKADPKAFMEFKKEYYGKPDEIQSTN